MSTTICQFGQYTQSRPVCPTTPEPQLPRSKMPLSLIVAMSKNSVIGKSGGLPWRLRSDLQRFKKITMGHTLIMGRKTFDSIGRALPGRRTIVISRSMTAREQIEVASSLAEALQMSRQDPEPFVVGGGEVYKLALPLADRIYLTRVDAIIDGDTLFPELDFKQYTLNQREQFAANDTDEYSHTFEIWERSGQEPSAA